MPILPAYFNAQNVGLTCGS